MIAAHIGSILIATGFLTMGAIALFLMPTRMLRLVFADRDRELGNPLSHR